AADVYDEDGGAPEAGARDAGTPAQVDAGEPVASGPSLAPDAGLPAAADPTTLAGGPTALKAENNVAITVASGLIRSHELGTQIGQLLTAIPQWKSSFEGTQLDPIRDFDHLYIAGPQLRDSRRVLAFMDYNVPQSKIRAAIDVLVDRSKPQ